MEKAMRIEVRLLFERDLVGLEGFWLHHDVPCSRRLTLPADALGEDVRRQAGELLQVPCQHFALFVLHTRSTLQVRFRFMLPNEPLRRSLRQCLPVNAAGNSGGESSFTSFTVLCVLSRGYDPFTLKWCPSSDLQVPREIWKWSRELALLIVKYFCPRAQRVVTLGCYYLDMRAPLGKMVAGADGGGTSTWLERRVKPFVERKVIAPLRDGMDFACWEEYSHSDPKDLLERNINATGKTEGLYDGDAIIWEPKWSLRALMQHGYPGAPDARLTLTNFSELLAAEVPHGAVTFAVAGREVDADRFLLAARSEYFEKMFRPGMVEAATTRVQVPSASFEGFRAVLRYIYAAGAVGPEFWAEADPLEILHLSVEFMLGDLTRLCESRLARDDMDVDTALARLRSVLPLRAKVPELADACIGALKGKMDAVPASAVAELCKFPDTMRELLVALDTPDSKRHKKG